VTLTSIGMDFCATGFLFCPTKRSATRFTVESLCPAFGKLCGTYRPHYHNFTRGTSRVTSHGRGISRVTCHGWAWHFARDMGGRGTLRVTCHGCGTCTWHGCGTLHVTCHGCHSLVAPRSAFVLKHNLKLSFSFWVHCARLRLLGRRSTPKSKLTVAVTR
jgi:hypothetical protein